MDSHPECINCSDTDEKKKNNDAEKINYFGRGNIHGQLSQDIICSERRRGARERSSRATVSFEEQIMFKDNYPCIFPKPKAVYCLYYPSNVSPRSGSTGVKQKRHIAKHVDFLVLPGTTLSTSVISQLKKNAPFRNLFARRWYLAVSEPYRLILNVHSSRADVTGSLVTIPSITHERKYLVGYNYRLQILDGEKEKRLVF